MFNKGAVASVYVEHPLDTIETKLQTFPNHHKNFLNCGRNILMENHVKALYMQELYCHCWLITRVGSMISFAFLFCSLQILKIQTNYIAIENGILFTTYGQC